MFRDKENSMNLSGMCIIGIPERDTREHKGEALF